MPHLPNELWVPILGFLRRPIPEARSAPPRSDLTAPDLCSAARVSKLFAEICQSILYRHIATDRLDLILPQNATELPSKLRLLAHTKSLFIEYRCKQPHAPYEFILQKRGGWDAVGVDQESLDAYTRATCAAEIEDLARGFAVLDEWGPSRVSFPNLETLSVCSIYGGQDCTWQMYHDHIDELHTYSEYPRPPLPYRAASLYQKFCHTSSLRHLCTRALHGALSTPPTSFASPEFEHETQAFSWTNHFSADVAGLPIPFNRSVHWVSDSPSTTDWRRTAGLVSFLFRKTSQWRKDGTHLGSRSDKVDIALYGSADFDASASDLSPHEARILDNIDAVPMSPELLKSYPTKNRRRVHQLGKLYEDQFQYESGLDARFRWFPSDMAPRCPACASLPPP